VTGTLRRDDGGPDRFLASLAEAHVHGGHVDWAAVLPQGQRVELPTYAFQHQRYWPRPGRRPEPERPVTADWRYRICWVPVADPGPVALSGTWLVVTGRSAGNLGEDCARALADHGARVVVVEAGPDTLDREVLADRIARESEVSGIVSLLGLEEGPLAGHPVISVGLAGTLGLVQALGDVGLRAPLWVLTRGAVAAGDGEAVASPVQAMVWGLGQVAGLELPQRWGGLVDLPPVLDERAAGRLCAVLAGCGEDQAAIRPAGIAARRLVRAPLPLDGRARWASPGTVLITGGTGAIGGHVARWAAGQGAPRVALASRSGPAAYGTARMAAALAVAGASTEVIACDTAQRSQIAGLLARIEASGPRLTAVMHAAGTTQAVAAVQDMTVAELAAVAEAKTAGAVHLDQLTSGTRLEGFVLFSSAAATWGSGGQAGYAAANAFLDGLAAHRHGRGLAGTSLAWGLWGGGGLGAGDAGTQLQRLGLRVMEPQLAIQALEHALGSGETQLTVADVDWARFAPTFTVRRASPLIGDLPEVSQALATGNNGSAADGARTALARRLAGLPEAEQTRILTDLVCAEAAAALGHRSAKAVGARHAFRDLGFDSLTAVELRNRISAATGLSLPATLVFDHPTPSAAAEYLRVRSIDSETDYMPVLEELDRLESALSSIARNGEGMLKITARLEALALQFRGEQTEDAEAGRELEAATDDEMFDLAEKELNISKFY
jgi:acyl transferase domain-containing protein